ncbi:hypothetical protein D8I24_7587 (plasmid) [Cupriavidus necator H850]|jgi:hypothetical protein|nr:hypothetical protein D8I24_7587 [Cupriavidus necator H850]
MPPQRHPEILFLPASVAAACRGAPDLAGLPVGRCAVRQAVIEW